NEKRVRFFLQRGYCGRQLLCRSEHRPALPGVMRKRMFSWVAGAVLSERRVSPTRARGTVVPLARETGFSRGHILVVRETGAALQVPYWADTGSPPAYDARAR